MKYTYNTDKRKYTNRETYIDRNKKKPEQKYGKRKTPTRLINENTHTNKGKQNR